MTNKFRKLPPVCLSVSLIRLITGRLLLSGRFVGEIIRMEEHAYFQVFRHIADRRKTFNSTHTVFVVSFKFARLSHKANKLASIIPMLLITGFPGFVKKIYAVNHETGYWQGMYQWESRECLEEYKKSLVFKVMNKRAIPGSVTSVQHENKALDDLVSELSCSCQEGRLPQCID